MAPKCFVFLLLWCTFDKSLGQGVLFPFGSSEGDTYIPANDDKDSGNITISRKLPFFDAVHDFLYVNTNGVISFLKAVPEYTPELFPLDGDRRLIAPFWADVDTTARKDGLVRGYISYREITNRSADQEELFQIADDIIHGAAYLDQGKFHATWMFIATWDRVGFYNFPSQSLEKPNNTFQAVVLTDGDFSFAIYNYGEIMWTTGTDSGGDADTGLGGFPAQAGFNAGDGIRYYNVPWSTTDAMVDIELTTNVGTTGRWVFRIDGAQIGSSGCDTAGLVEVYPIVSSMLGGEEILIKGPCFKDTDKVVCKFHETSVKGELVSNTKARCITPTFFRVGRIPFTVSLDGGLRYDFKGIFTIVSIDQAPPSGITSDFNQWSDGREEFTITWDTDKIAHLVEFCDIHLLAYLEDRSSGNVKFDQIVLLGEEIPYTNGILTFDRRQLDVKTSYTVGIIKLVPSGAGYKSTEPALWTTVLSLTWATPKITPATRCANWYENEMQLPNFVEYTHSCPCTHDQASNDTGRFTAYPECDIRQSKYCLKRLKDVRCFRANVPTSVGGGQECCYGEAGGILNVRFSPGGGFAHRNHHSGFPPYEQPGKVPTFSHFQNDIVSWENCCCFNSKESNRSCENYKKLRPSQTCVNYIPPPPGGGTGDPHLITLDGSSYTFNGLGEYILVSANDSSFVVQARTSVPASTAGTSYNVTAFSAVAAKFNESDTVHVEVNERRVLDVWVRLNRQDTWTRLDFNAQSSWVFDGFYVNGHNIIEDGILIVFDLGCSLQIKATSDIMSILFLGTSTFRNDTRGLLGTWNGDPDDDFMLPDGFTVLPTSSSTRELHAFGQSWEISGNSSLFYYPPGLSCEDFRDTEFIPEFEPPGNPGIDNETLLEVCQGNEWCIFDFQVTVDKQVALASRIAYEAIKAITNASQNVVICGPLDSPQHGSKAVTKFSVGGIAYFSCLSGYVLEGEEEIMCLSEGDWSAETPVCVLEATGPNIPGELILIIVAGVVGSVLIVLAVGVICYRKRKYLTGEGVNVVI